MDQKLPAITTKLWRLVRMIFKRKVLIDLNIIMKRVKIAGKPFNRHPHHLPPYGEYEFSCSNTPTYPISRFSTRNKHRNKINLPNSNPNPVAVDDCDDLKIDPEVIKVLNYALTASQAMPGFMKSPVVERLEIRDQVDEAAEKFIRRFYSDLRRENV